MIPKVAILISGGGSNMETLVRDMQSKGYAQPVLVLSNNADAGGLAKAANLNVPTAVVDHRPFKGDRAAFEAALLSEITDRAPDIICLAGFMRVLTEGFVSQFEGRMLNIHPSLLPKYKGLNTHARAIEAGDVEAGCSVHLVTPALDDGPLLGQARVPILDGDTPGSLAQRVLHHEHLLYPACLETFASQMT